MDRALGYLALARKAGLVELGEEHVGAVTRAGKAYLVMVAKDASDHTWRRALSFVAGTQQQCLRLPYTKDELGFAIGRQELAIAAITDAAMALSFAKAVPGAKESVVAALEEKAQKLQQRRKEAQAHARNVRKGKK